MTFRIGIELGLTGASAVKDGLKDIGGAAKGLADEFRNGLKTGMDQAVREMNRPMEELKTLANEAAKALDIRPDWKIQEEIDKTRKAYDDLKASGLATSNELARAKDSMKSKIGELRQEMGKWSGDWDSLAKKLDDYGSKLQALGAKAMIAGAPAILAGKASIEAEHNLAGIANTSGIDPALAEQTVTAWKAKIAELSVFTNQKQSELVEAMGAMVSRGLDPEKALAMLGPIGNAATATGGKIGDIARTLYATYDNLKVPINESAKTLDVLATAGNRGAFELKDMAQYLPSLTAIAGSLKMVGIESTAQIAAAAQIAMKGAGDASQAANNLQNFLLKLSAPDTMKAFKDAGINLSAEIKKGLDNGDLIGHIAGVVQQATNGDAEKISTLFRDAQVKQFITPMLANIEEYKAIRDQALAAVGTIDRQKEVMQKTLDEKFKGIGIAFDAAMEKSSLFHSVLDKIKSTADWFAANPGVFEPIAATLTALAVGGAGLAAVGVALPAIATGITAIGGAGAAVGTAALAATATGITAIAAAGPALVAAAPAIAAVLGAIAAWKVGDAVGTWLADQIDEMVKAVTGDKAATLGTALYDLIEGENGILSWPGKIEAKAGEWAASGAALLNGLKSGMQGAVADLIKNLGITNKLAEAEKIVAGTAKDWLKVGQDIIEGLWEGITATMRKPLDAIGDLARKLPQWAKDLLGIHSPSKVFEEIGSQAGAGMAIGIDKSTEIVKGQADKQARAAVAAASTGVLGTIEATSATIKKLTSNYDKVEATVDSLAVGYEKLTSAVESGDFAKMAESAMGALENVSSSAKTLKSAYEDTMKSITGLAEKSDVLRPAIEKLNGVMPALSGWISGLASTAWASISSGFAAVATAFNASIVPLMSNPIVLAIVGAAAAGAVVYLYWDNIAAAVDRAMKAITGAINDAAEVVNKTLDDWRQFGVAVVESIRAGIADKLQGALGIKAKFDQAVKDMKGTIADWVGIGAAMIEGLWEGIQATLRMPLEAIGDLAKKLPRWAKDLLGIKSPSRVFVAIGEQIGAGMVVGIAESEDAVRAAVEGLGEAAIYAGDAATLEFIRRQEQAIAELRAEMTGLGAAAQANAGKARDWFGRFLPDDAAAQVAAMGEQATADIGQSLSDALMNGFKKGKDYGREMADAMRGTFANLVLRPLIQPVTASIAGAASGVLTAFMPGTASASGGAGGLGDLAGSVVSAITGGIGEAVGGIASAMGASTGVATGLGAFASSAVPVLGAIALMASLFGGKPSGKSAWGEVDLASGERFGVGSQTGDKYSAENNQAVTAMSQAATEYAALLRAMGGTVTGSHRFSASDRFGYGLDVYAEGQGYTSTDREAFLRRLFSTLVDEAEGLDATLATLLRTFEGTSEAATKYAAALGSVGNYLSADVLTEGMTAARNAARTVYQAWTDAGSAARAAASSFDGTVATAQALGTATAAMYQAELSMVAQIQGLLGSTSAAFGESIRSIEMSVLDTAGKYDYLRAEIDAAYARLGAAVDPQVIGDLAGQINRLSMEAYGLLDDGQKRGAADEYTAYLRDVNSLTSERLNAAQDRVESQHAAMVDAIEAAMGRVAERMEAAARAQEAAAATPVQVASTIRVDFSADIPGNAEVGYGGYQG